MGNRTRVKVIKNKLAPPFREVEFDIMYGTGISKEGSLIDLGVDENVIDKSGAWYSFSGTRIGQGRENAKDFLKENKDMATIIELNLLEKFGLAKPANASKKTETSVDSSEDSSDGKAPAKRQAQKA